MGSYQASAFAGLINVTNQFKTFITLHHLSMPISLLSSFGPCDCPVGILVFFFLSLICTWLRMLLGKIASACLLVEEYQSLGSLQKLYLEFINVHFVSSYLGK